MTHVAIIPARSGSKGVSDKNILPFRGTTLIGQAASIATQAGVFQRIFLSTDSERYADEGRRAGCEVPFLRPQELASDRADIQHVLLDLLEKLDPECQWDTFTLLEPTCPLRTVEMVRSCFDFCRQDPELDAALTVSPIPPSFHALKQFYVSAEDQVSYAHPEGGTILNRQMLPVAYCRNGGAYVIRCRTFRQTRQLLTGKIRALRTTERLVSIDTWDDVEKVRALEK